MPGPELPYWAFLSGTTDSIKGNPKNKLVDQNEGFIGTTFFYGYGDDGEGLAEPCLSGKLA
jgi:hypothetical protein